MKKIILILFSLNTFALSLTEKSLCFYSEGSRADIINYNFFTDGSSEIRGLSQEGEVLFQDELTWSEKKLGEELVVNIKFPASYYYPSISANVLYANGFYKFTWLNVSHNETFMSECF